MLCVPVNWNVRGSANIERIVLVVADLVGVRGCSFARGQDLSRLLGHFGIRAELEESLSKHHGRLEVLQLEEEIECRAQCEDLVDGLEIAVRKVRSQLKKKKYLYNKNFNFRNRK